MKKLLQTSMLVVFMAGLLLSSCSQEDELPTDSISVDQNVSLMDARMTDPEDSTYDPFNN